MIIGGNGGTSIAASGRHMNDTTIGADDTFVFKVTDSNGNVHRIKSSSYSAEDLYKSIADKIEVAADTIIVKFVDEDKDEAVISSDDSLREAVDCALNAGQRSLKLNVVPKNNNNNVGNVIGIASNINMNTTIWGSVGVAAAVAVGVVVALRNRNN